MPDRSSLLPEVVRHPSVARASISPSAIVAAGAGVGIGVWDRSAVWAVVLGVLGWTGRMVVAVAGNARRRRAASPLPVVIDPWAVPEPWRQLARDALSAQSRFDRMVSAHPPGPAADRLRFIQVRIRQGVEEVWALAQQAAALTSTSSRSRNEALSNELRRIQEERATLLRVSPGTARVESLDQSEAAVAAQLQAARRAETAAQRAIDRLRVLTARLDEAVTSLVELSLAVDGQEAAVTGSTGAIDSVVDEITALRQATLEACAAAVSPGSLPGPSVPAHRPPTGTGRPPSDT